MSVDNTNKRLLTREILLSLIENRDSNIIDLSRYEMKSFDFSNLTLQKIEFSNFHNSHICDLSNAIFKNSNLIDCKFSGAIFKGTTFRESSIKWCDFRYSQFEQTTFQKATIYGADYYRAEFHGNNIFEEAQLVGVSLYMANLQGAGIRKDNLNGYILQEDEKLFREFHVHYSNVPQLTMEQYISKRFYEAMVVYRILMGVWTSNGLLKDASWAYVKSKRMEKNTYAPWRSWKIYSRESLSSNMTVKKLKKTKIIISKLPRYYSFVFIDAVCGFGESITKVLISIGIVLIAGAIIYLQLKGIVDSKGIVNTNVADNLVFSLSNMTSTNIERLKPANQIIEVILAIQSFIGIALAGLLGFILGNKIRSS